MPNEESVNELRSNIKKFQIREAVMKGVRYDGPEEYWQAQVVILASQLLSVLSESEFVSGCKIPYQDSGWPEMLVSRIKERFENFDEEATVKFISNLEKELDK